MMSQPPQASAPIGVTVVQDVATPHNNVLLKALQERGDVQLDVWYAKGAPGQYGWKNSLNDAVVPARLYEARWPDWRFLKHMLALPWSQKILLVGWRNPSTKVLFFALWALRRPFAMWFDDPADGIVRSPIKHLVREAFYQVLRTSRAHVFAVGRRCMEFFKQRAFADARLTNLPILVDLPDVAPFAARRAEIRQTHGVNETDVLLVAGSRLVPEKGFDLPIVALSHLTPEERSRVKLVIVGKGPEKENLECLIAQHQLTGRVTLLEWLEFRDFQALLKAADAHLHPARFDAWGSTIFAHALGVPVIGSRTAGSAVDRIVSGKNGWLYEAEDAGALAEHVRTLLQLSADQRQAMGQAARATAEVWPPAKGAERVLSMTA